MAWHTGASLPGRVTPKTQKIVLTRIIKLVFQTFFVWVLLLIVHTWNRSPLGSNLLRQQCTCYTVQTTSERPHQSPLVRASKWPSSQPLSSTQFSHNDSFWAKGITKSHWEQGLDYRETEELFLCPSCSNRLWKGWSCRLMHCPAGNATDSISRVLASSEGIFSWTPLKTQHSNHNPNPLANQLWSIDFLTPPTPLIIPQTHCLSWISYATQKLMLHSCKMVQKQPEAFHTFLWYLFQV